MEIIVLCINTISLWSQGNTPKLRLGPNQFQSQATLLVTATPLSPFWAHTFNRTLNIPHISHQIQLHKYFEYLEGFLPGEWKRERWRSCCGRKPSAATSRDWSQDRWSPETLVRELWKTMWQCGLVLNSAACPAASWSDRTDLKIRQNSNSWDWIIQLTSTRNQWRRRHWARGGALPPTFTNGWARGHREEKNV